MKIGCFVYLLITLGIMVYGMFFLDESGYYRVVGKEGATLHSSVFTSEKDIIGVAPRDTILKIDDFENEGTAEMSIDGQIVYLKTEDLQLVDKTYDWWGVMQYFFYFILLLVCLYYGYKYLSKNHVGVLARIKTGVYILLSAAIVVNMVYVMQHSSKPPRLTPEGKSRIVKELNFKGYNPPLDTEVEVLCKVNHSTLVRDSKGYQFMVPAGGLSTRIKNLSELNEHFTYNVNKERLEACMDQNLDSLLVVAGDYVTGMAEPVSSDGIGGMAHIYEFPHLVAVGNGERFQGVRVVTNDFCIVQDIQYYEGGHSENVFGRLPFYEEIACRNLCFSTGMTGDNNIWERLFNVVGNFFFLGLVVFILARTVGVITLWFGKGNVVVGRITKFVLWIVLLPVVYVYTMALMDFYHGMWIVVAVYALTMIGGLFQLGMENSGKSIYMCPKCGKKGVYNPKEVEQSRRTVGTIHYRWMKNPVWADGVEIPEKTYTREITYTLDGSCKSCGFEDRRLYTREMQVTTTTDCPLCGHRMKFSIIDGMYEESCPRCGHNLVDALVKKARLDRSEMDTDSLPDEKSNDGWDQKKRKEEESKWWNQEMNDYEDKARNYYNKYKEAVERARELENTDNDEGRKYALEKAQSYWEQYEYYKSEAERARSNML